MSNFNYRVGGIAYLNNGEIIDSYSKVKISGSKNIRPSGVVWENRGVVERTFCEPCIGGEDSYGVSGSNRGTFKEVFWIKTSSGDNKSFRDMQYVVEEDKLQKNLFKEWDFQNTWIWNGKDENFEGISLNGELALLGERTDVVEINSVSDLLKLSDKVNSGGFTKDTKYILKNDLNLGGRLWSPIGEDSAFGFDGIFDGNGHSITNFKISSKKSHLAGFFGKINPSGVVANLTIDCIITKSGSVAAPMAAHNSGKIINCVAVSRTSLSKTTGGFVGQNDGSISRCAALGKVTPAFLIPWWSLIAALLLIAIVMPIYFYVNGQELSKDLFAPMITDPNVKPVKESEEPKQNATSSNNSDTRAVFFMNSEMTVSKDNNSGQIGLTCPSYSKRGFIATIYDESGKMIYKSGLIKPGYKVDMITLRTSLSEGSHKCRAVLDFYDINTNEKGSINSSLQLLIKVK